MDQFDATRKMMRELRKVMGGGTKGAMRQLRKLGLDRLGQS